MMIPMVPTTMNSDATTMNSDGTTIPAPAPRHRYLHRHLHAQDPKTSLTLETTISLYTTNKYNIIRKLRTCSTYSFIYIYVNISTLRSAILCIYILCTYVYNIRHRTIRTNLSCFGRAKRAKEARANERVSESVIGHRYCDPMIRRPRFGFSRKTEEFSAVYE
jgi:hypothetical protein